MNSAVRHFFQKTPVLRVLYVKARKAYHASRTRKALKDYFLNSEDFRQALNIEDGKLVEIRTKDGLSLTIRRNCMDAGILMEVFLENSYVQGLSLPGQPVVVDIGGYIGDFALYAAKILGAQKVVVCEPSPRNWKLLTKNVANNHYEDRIEMVNKAVGDGQPLLLNVDAPDRAQARVSAYGPETEARKLVPGTTLADVVKDHGLGVIDLLKIDCEGGEYAILLSAPAELFARIRNIVFEFHEIPGFEPKLNAVKQRLGDAGYSLRINKDLVYATRA
jgi:FkbM family methyltransferase